MKRWLNSPNRRGIAATVGGMACFMLNDTLVKIVSKDLASAQLIFIRGLFASLLLLLAARHFFDQRTASSYSAGLRHKQVMQRAAIDAVATMCYLTALFHLPIGNATAINMAVPIFIAAGAAFFFHEPVSSWRWCLILAGFVGVMLVIQPKAEGFNAYGLLCLAGTLLHAARDLLTRSIPRQIPSIMVTLATALAVTALAGVLSLAQGWRPIHLPQLSLLALAACFLGAGYLLMVMSMRQGDMALIAPFRYSALPIALTIGYLVWGDVPNLLAWSGIILLAVAGVAMLRSRN